jgi:CheY-like chemotaxis protein
MCEERMADRPPKPSSHQPSLLAGKRVLIAEDSRAQQRLLSVLLGNLGLAVTLVEDGQEAIHRARHEAFDAILLDMQMPHVDGYEAAAQLRGAGFRGPIVALTADTLRGDEERCLEAGCDGYLAKPVQPAELLGLLMRLLGTTALVIAAPSSSMSHEELLREFVNGLSERTQKVQAALASRDRTTLGQLAHKMRGAAAMYGFTELAETAGLLEVAVREGRDHDLLAELVGEMEAEARRPGTP